MEIEQDIIMWPMGKKEGKRRSAKRGTVVGSTYGPLE